MRRLNPVEQFLEGAACFYFYFGRDVWKKSVKSCLFLDNCLLFEALFVSKKCSMYLQNSGVYFVNIPSSKILSLTSFRAKQN